MTMRRCERKVTTKKELRTILDASFVCRLAMVDDGVPYIVPLNFGYEWTDELPVIYFHCADSGRKLDILRRTPSVCLEVDDGYTLIETGEACGYTNTYRSLIGEGTAAILTTHEDKAHALQCLMRHVAGREFEFTERETSMVTLVAVTMHSLSGKQYL